MCTFYIGLNVKIRCTTNWWNWPQGAKLGSPCLQTAPLYGPPVYRPHPSMVPPFTDPTRERGGLTFCMHMSAMMDRGMVRLRARVPISEDVRKQPLGGREFALSVWSHWITVTSIVEVTRCAPLERYFIASLMPLSLYQTTWQVTLLQYLQYTSHKSSAAF